MSRWSRDEDKGPMSLEEMIEVRAEKDREVARLSSLRSLPRGHPNNWPYGRNHSFPSKTTDRDRRYIEAIKTHRWWPEGCLTWACVGTCVCWAKPSPSETQVTEAPESYATQQSMPSHLRG